MPATKTTHFTSGEVGDLLSVQAWKIARLFELGIIAEPSRIGGRRLIPRSLIPEIVTALQAKGWLKDSAAVDGEVAQVRHELTAIAARRAERMVARG